jgi:hypothetical protein
MDDVSTHRVEAFKKLIESYNQAPTDYDEGEEEDPRLYIEGHEPIAPWCCVTVNYSSHGYAKHFFLPCFEERDAAELRATEFAQDGTFEELPVAVVNLDTGETHEPNWGSVEWR